MDASSKRVPEQMDDFQAGYAHGYADGTVGEYRPPRRRAIPNRVEKRYVWGVGWQDNPDATPNRDAVAHAIFDALRSYLVGDRPNLRFEDLYTNEQADLLDAADEAIKAAAT